MVRFFAGVVGGVVVCVLTEYIDFHDWLTGRDRDRESEEMKREQAARLWATRSDL